MSAYGIFYMNFKKLRYFHTVCNLHFYHFAIRPPSHSGFHVDVYQSSIDYYLVCPFHGKVRNACSSTCASAMTNIISRLELGVSVTLNIVVVDLLCALAAITQCKGLCFCSIMRDYTTRILSLMACVHMERCVYPQRASAISPRVGDMPS